MLKIIHLKRCDSNTYLQLQWCCKKGRQFLTVPAHSPHKIFIYKQQPLESWPLSLDRPSKAIARPASLSLLHTSDVSAIASARTFTLEHKRRKQGGLYLALTIALTFCRFTLEDFWHKRNRKRKTSTRKTKFSFLLRLRLRLRFSRFTLDFFVLRLRLRLRLRR